VKKVTANQICRGVLRDLYDGVNEGDQSIPLSNAWEGLHDAMVILGLIMSVPGDRRQLSRYKEAVRLSRKPRTRRY
jgi:hypothetical protein